VLLVEDNVDAARALSLMLLGEGCDVGVAHDGEEALELASARDYDVALVDIGLPDMTGYELVEELGRRGTRPAKSYALTGFGHDKARARIAEAGFDAHLIKPVDFEELLGLLRALAR
jgi:CheY-like chemotaxis protein